MSLHQFSSFIFNLFSRSKLENIFTSVQYPSHEASSMGRFFHLTSTYVTPFPSMFTILLSMMSSGSRICSTESGVPDVAPALPFPTSSSFETWNTWWIRASSGSLGLYSHWAYPLQYLVGCVKERRELWALLPPTETCIYDCSLRYTQSPSINSLFPSLGSLSINHFVISLVSNTVF